MEVFHLICGIPEEKDTNELLERIVFLAAKKNRKVEIHLCHCKIEVEYMVYCTDGNAAVLLQENFELQPYEAHELVAIRDIRDIPVIISLSHKHYGTNYLASLYAAGIVDAVYEEEANAVCLTERLFCRRNRKSCREYYGIQTLEEVVASLAIIPTDALARYQNYIMGATDQKEMFERYTELSKKLSYIENCYLIEQLSAETVADLKKNPSFIIPNPTRKKKRKG